jgi:hypothetical protein
MFDFDVVTGPTNPTRSAKPATPPAAKPLTMPAPTAAVAVRDTSRAAEHPFADPADSRR